MADGKPGRPARTWPSKRNVHPKAADANIIGPMADRIGADGKRNLKLTIAERKGFARQRLISKVVALFLDPTTDHSYKEIADACGISKSTLIDMTKADDFIEAWNDEYVELGADPMVKAARQKLQSLAPKAARTLESIMDDPSATAGARVTAAKEILRLAGIGEPIRNKSDKSELQDFLRSAGINIESMAVNMPMPPGYEKVTQVIDGQLKDAPVPDQEDQ
jgi:hypothetical protein